MKKELLLNILENTTLKCDPDQSKRAIYDKYCCKILTLLAVLPDNVEINGIPYLEQSEFSSQDNFENFIRSDSSEVERVLDKLADRFTEWTKNYIRVHTEESKVLYGKSDKKHIGTTIFVIVIILTVFTAALFSALDIVGMIEYGNQVSTVIGCLDFVCGVGFFLYEFLSDKRKNNVLTDAKQCAEEGNYDKFYRIYINKSFNKNKININIK